MKEVREAKEVASSLAPFTIFTTLTHPAMRWSLPIVLLFTLSSCNSGTPKDPPNRWADERLWPVLEAQEHRDTDALCALLRHGSAEVREAAALAFASVQDSAAIPCLLSALSDRESLVRSNAAFALGFVADSAALAAILAAAYDEPDTAAARIMLEAGFRTELFQRKHDAVWHISYLESDNRDIRTRAAQGLARLPKDALVEVANSVMHAVDAERDPTVRMFLVAALKSNDTGAAREELKRLATSDSLPMIRIAALRALGAKLDGEMTVFFLERLGDPHSAVRQAALEQLERLPGPLPGEAFAGAARTIADHSIWIPLHGLAIRHGAEETGARSAAAIREMDHRAMPPYLLAAWTKVRWWDSDTARTVMLGERSAVVRQAAMDTWLEHFAEALKTKEVPKMLRDETHSSFMREALTSGDAGLIASACDQIATEETAYLQGLLDTRTVMSIRSSLHPIRDLEALRFLEVALAKRDGLPPPKHAPPPFNHPIDPAKLRALPQGQRYRITTTKGTIVIATDVNDCPGSSLAFDSLVTAGYYNGKAFHRMVPNFVVQGGCPRGDGYGGMPWTLRTEIGRKPFTAGSVGLASAGRDTESCQFFITHSATPHLDGRYTRFGEVVEGMDVVWRLQVGDVMLQIERVD